MNWQLAEAKNRFSEVVRLALAQEPQRISKRDEAVIVISEEQYQSLIGNKLSFIEYLCSAQTFKDLDISRDNSPMRNVDL